MREKLSFENSKGDKLVGVLSNPNGSVDVPIVILCHGFSSSKESKTFTSMERGLNRFGIASFRFDFYGHGESDGKFEDITISEAVDDILRAIDFLKGKGYSRIGLLGSSFGGISSIMAASKSDDLVVLALKGPVSDYKEVELLRKGLDVIERWRESGFMTHCKSDGTPLKLNYSFYEDIKNNNGYQAAEKIKIPVIIVHGDADEVVPLEQSKKTCEIIEDCRLEIIPGANHRFKEGDSFERSIDFFVDFIVDNLK